jgi:hypothetical protein
LDINYNTVICTEHIEAKAGDAVFGVPFLWRAGVLMATPRQHGRDAEDGVPYEWLFK